MYNTDDDFDEPNPEYDDMVTNDDMDRAISALKVTQAMIEEDETNKKKEERPPKLSGEDADLPELTIDLYNNQSDSDLIENLFTYKTITFKPGATAVLGANGCGKSTLLQHMYNTIKHRDFPYTVYEIDPVRIAGMGNDRPDIFVDRSDDSLFGSFHTEIDIAKIKDAVVLLYIDFRAVMEHRRDEDIFFQDIHTGMCASHGEYLINRFSNVLEVFKRFKDLKKEQNISIVLLTDGFDDGAAVPAIHLFKYATLKTLSDIKFKHKYWIFTANQYESIRKIDKLTVLNVR